MSASQLTSFEWQAPHDASRSWGHFVGSSPLQGLKVSFSLRLFCSIAGFFIGVSRQLREEHVSLDFCCRVKMVALLGTAKPQIRITLNQLKRERVGEREGRELNFLQLKLHWTHFVEQWPCPWRNEIWNLKFWPKNHPIQFQTVKGIERSLWNKQGIANITSNTPLLHVYRTERLPETASSFHALPYSKIFPLSPFDSFILIPYLANQHLKEENAWTPPVSTETIRLPTKNFRCHILRGSYTIGKKSPISLPKGDILPLHQQTVLTASSHEYVEGHLSPVWCMLAFSFSSPALDSYLLMLYFFVHQ